MGRLLSPPSADIADLDVLATVSVGGTGSDNSLDAADQLQGISIYTKGLANSVIGLDADGKIPLDKLPESSVKQPTLQGPTELGTGQTGVYTISNFDSKTTYTVSSTSGSVSLSGSQITLVAPNTPQFMGLIINNRFVTIEVANARPNKPNLALKDFGVVNNAGLIISADTFTMLKGSNTHSSTDWEVSVTSNFSNTVFSSYNDLINKTSVTVSNLIPGANYFIRARYRDSANNLSNWSKTYSVKTKTSYVLSKEIGRLIALDRSTADNLGVAISMSGDSTRCAVSANLADVSGVVDCGAVYVYIRSGLSWKFEAKLTTSDKLASDKLGNSISMNFDGSRIAIGCSENSPGGTSKAGAVYIFMRSGVTWTQETKLFAADKTANDSFGFSVSLDKDATRLAIGAPLATMSAKANAGAVYIYTRSGVNWTQETKITSSDVAATDNFGSSVSLDSAATRLVVGAPKADNTSIVDTGSSYVFLRTGTVWAQEAKLVATTLAASSFQGSSVAISSDGLRIISGAPGLDNSTDANTCSAYVFLRSGTSWAQEAKLQASDRIMGDQFGAKVAINANSDRIVVGAKLAEVVGIIDAGSVYVFARNNISWTQEVKLVATDKAASAYFGSAVSLSSDGVLLVVGSNSADSGGTVDSGHAYVFTS